jgi:predicted nucleotidyltransferase
MPFDSRSFRDQTVPTGYGADQRDRAHQAGGHQASAAQPSVDWAREIVVRHVRTAFPTLCAALLSGSIVRAAATETSDIDVVVLLPEGAGSRRETTTWDGAPVDLFVYDPDGLTRWLGKDTQGRRPVLCSLLIDGHVVAGDAAAAEQAKALARKVYEAGPAKLSDAELDRLRFEATDLMLDLQSTVDRSEALLLAAMLVQTTGDLVLNAAGRWTGRGKWLPRELRAYDPELARDLAAAHDDLARTGDAEMLIRLVDNILARHGGRMVAGRMEAG